MVNYGWLYKVREQHVSYGLDLTHYAKEDIRL